METTKPLWTSIQFCLAIPAMAAELRNPSVPLIHVSYEQVVSNPEETLKRLTDFLEVSYEPEALITNGPRLQKG